MFKIIIFAWLIGLTVWLIRTQIDLMVLEDATLEYIVRILQSMPNGDQIHKDVMTKLKEKPKWIAKKN